MKHIILFTLIISLIFTTSCHTHRYKSEAGAQSKQVQVVEEQRWQLQLQRDSTRRYWSVFTDSVFYFHPDSGLWAKGGWLYAEEQRVYSEAKQTAQRNKDSILQEQSSYVTVKEMTRKLALPWYVYVMGVLILGIVAWVRLRINHS